MARILILAIISSANCFMQVDIIKAYFAVKSLKSGVVIGCLNKKEQLRLVTDLNHENLFFNVIDGGKADIKHIFLRTRHYGVILDADCHKSKDLLKMSGDLSYFGVRYHWLILSLSRNITDLFKHVKLYVNTDINIATPILQNNTDELEIIDFYNPSSVYGGEFIYTPLGLYTPEKGYNARMKVNKYWLRKNFTGINFKTSVVLPEPFEGTLLEYLDSDMNREINTFNRFHSSVMHICQKYYNFSMDITLSRSWGYLDSDGTFDGMVGELERQQIDFGLSPLFVRDDRGHYIDYGRRTWVLRAAFIFRNPKARTSIQIFLEPLSTSTWLLTLLSGTIGVFALRMCYKQEQMTMKDSTIDNSWSILIISVIGAMCQQGLTKTARLTSARIITLFLFFLFLLIYQFYSASIVSHLLMKVTTTIKTVQDILLSPLEVGCEDILYNRDYFLYTTDVPSKELYAKKIHKRFNKSNFLPVEEGVRLVEKGNYAFHVELATAYPIIEKTFGLKEICELREVQMYKTQPMHSNYQKHSPYKDLLDTCLQRLGEHGTLHREIGHWHPRKPECVQNSNSKEFNVGFDDFYPALMSVAIGIGLSLIVLAIEIYIHRKSIAHSKQKEPILIYPFTK